MPLPDRPRLIHGALAVFALAIVARAAKVQLVEGDKWAARAQRQQLSKSALPAPRGPILDASGVLLAESREFVKLAIAPREVRDRPALHRALTAGGVAASWVARATDTTRAWVALPGTYLPSDVAGALGTRGVYATPVARRLYTQSEGMRRVVGGTTETGDAVDGVELALDSILRGERGDVALVNDARGSSFESPSLVGRAPRAGHTVTLTINHALQDICDRALADALAKLGASGGDIVVLDPHSGEILAMASRRAGRAVAASTALTEPYEPGSTLKPFIAGTLLALGRARVDEVIETYGGVYRTNKRTITDVHKADRMSFAEVIRWSSNVGIVRFAERLSTREEYEALRDFGFGSPTGLPYPSESPGTLHEPRRWSRQSPASLAMGYEIAVTPVQLATAYATIANGGELLAPALVKEIRTADGRVRYAHERRVVRRVLPTPVAAQIRTLLASVVDSGTATEADLATFAVAGKSGTARRTAGRRYKAGSYTASFVGLFPADAPQYVIVVKLDDPQGGSYYGGKTAAPVSKVVLEAAIAARDAALDRDGLSVRRGPRPKPKPATPVSPAVALARAARQAKYDSAHPPLVTQPALGVPEPAVSGAVLAVGRAPGAAAQPAADNGARAVEVAKAIPDVRGLPLRVAVRTLHQAGFRVQLERGANGATLPAAGSPAPVGSVVRLYHTQ